MGEFTHDTHETIIYIATTAHWTANNSEFVYLCGNGFYDFNTNTILCSFHSFKMCSIHDLLLLSIGLFVCLLYFCVIDISAWVWSWFAFDGRDAEVFSSSVSERSAGKDCLVGIINSCSHKRKSTMIMVKLIEILVRTEFVKFIATMYMRNI